MSTPRGIAVLGSTGSIGGSTLDVIARHPERFRVAALRAHGSWQTLVEQVRQFSPSRGARRPGGGAPRRARRSGRADRDTRVRERARGARREVAGENVQVVMAAIVGAAGLTPDARRGARRQAPAAREQGSAGHGRAASHGGGRAVRARAPADRQRAQCASSSACLPAIFPGEAARGVTRVLLDRLGRPVPPHGPRRALEHVTPDEACTHPNWVMGRKISVDSATLMNKGLEVIEATLAVRSAARAGRSGGASAEHRALAGRVRRRLGARAARAPDMRTPDRARAGVARAHRLPVYNRSICARSDSWISSRPITCASPASRLPGRGACRGHRARRAERRQRGGGAGVSRAALELYRDLRRSLTRCCSASMRARFEALDDVLDADAAARRLASGLISACAWSSMHEDC